MNSAASAAPQENDRSRIGGLSGSMSYAIPLVVTYIATPELLEHARQNGIIVVQSFEWN